MTSTVQPPDPLVDSLPKAISAPLTIPFPEAVPSVEYFIDCPTDTVEHYFAGDSYFWSDELYRIHGYERGDVVPTLELGMSHFHPTDKDAVRAFWAKITTTGGPSSVYASLLDLKGRTHKLLISADLVHNDEGQPVGVWAPVVDLTRSIHADMHPPSFWIEFVPFKTLDCSPRVISTSMFSAFRFQPFPRTTPTTLPLPL